MTAPRLVSVADAAPMLGLGSKNSVYKLIADGELPVVEVGRVSKVDVADIEAFIERHKRTAPGGRRLRSA